MEAISDAAPGAREVCVCVGERERRLRMREGTFARSGAFDGGMVVVVM